MVAAVELSGVAAVELSGVAAVESYLGLQL